MSQRFQITRAAELESLQVFRNFIADCCAKINIPDGTVFDLKLAVDEACTNIMVHGYKGMNPGSIILTFRIESNRILVQITDFVTSLSLLRLRSQTLRRRVEDREMGGLGLYLIYQTMDNIDYQTSDDGNTLTFTKYIK